MHLSPPSLVVGDMVQDSHHVWGPVNECNTRWGQVEVEACQHEIPLDAKILAQVTVFGLFRHLILAAVAVEEGKF